MVLTLIRYTSYIDRDAVFVDLFRKLAKHAGHIG
ncbi:hypothetical protein J2T14_002501 [Paenibacillus harenae]|nr:hypothetical protein [Paenibacillus harenae]